MNPQPPNEYGWLTARTDAEIEALGVILSGDEVQQWGKWNPFAPRVHGQKFAKGLNPVRRPINPNSDQPPGSEPFEMVPFKECADGWCEYTNDGETWKPFSTHGQTPEYWVYVQECGPGKHPPILAVRRRKPVESIQDSTQAAIAKGELRETPTRPYPFTQAPCKICGVRFGHAVFCTCNEVYIKSEPAPNFTPEQLDEANNILFPDGYMLQPSVTAFKRAVCRRHLAVVKEWQAKFQAERKAHQELILCMPPEQRWLHISPGNLPKAGQGFACAWEVNGKKYATAHPNGTPDPASMLLKNATGYIGWFPLPPLPEQQSEAERCIDDIYDVCELRPVATKQELAVLAKSILDWAQKKTKE